MRVRIRTRDADLKARSGRFGGGWGDESDASGAVLEAPGDGNGGPEVLDEALVAVHCGCEDGHDVGEAVEDTSKEVAAHVGEVGDVWVGRVGVCGVAREEVGAGGGDEGEVHVAAVSGEALTGFGHEAGRDAVGCGDGFNNVFKETGAVGHAFDVAKGEGGFEDARAGLSMPTFNVGVELLAGVKDTIVVVFVMEGTR